MVFMTKISKSGRNKLHYFLFSVTLSIIFLFMNYNEALEYLYNRLPVFHISGGSAYKPGFDNTNKLMLSLQNPHTRFKSVHVAGTNGKGSVSHMLASVLQSSGYKVGLYTSPHLVDFGERIRINGKMIDEQYVVDFIERQRSVIETIQPSFFELTMAMAFSYFADYEVDIAIIEVGLGGRLDSTNIVMPLVSVITNISFDHTEFLGNTIPEIAFEKAGIIKPNIPVVVSETNHESAPVFIAMANKQDSSIYFADNEIPVKYLESSYTKMRVDANSLVYEVGLTGKYQLKNIAAVLMTVEILKNNGFNCSFSQVSNGLSNVIVNTGFMGRWQCISERPAIFVDTAHNFAGISELINHVKLLKYRKLRLVFGMVKDKDLSAILHILPKDAHYYFTNASVLRALPAANLAEKAFEHELMGEIFQDIRLAVETVIQDAYPDDLTVIFGSNFVVGEALVALKNTIM